MIFWSICQMIYLLKYTNVQLGYNKFPVVSEKSSIFPLITKSPSLKIPSGSVLLIQYSNGEKENEFFGAGSNTGIFHDERRTDGSDENIFWKYDENLVDGNLFTSLSNIGFEDYEYLSYNFRFQNYSNHTNVMFVPALSEFGDNPNHFYMRLSKLEDHQYNFLVMEDKLRYGGNNGGVVESEKSHVNTILSGHRKLATFKIFLYKPTLEDIAVVTPPGNLCFQT